MLENDIYDAVTPEGFYNAKQVKAMGFTKGLIARLLPEPAYVRPDGAEYPTRVWRAEDVKAAMRTSSFRRKQRNMASQRHAEMTAQHADD